MKKREVGRASGKYLRSEKEEAEYYIDINQTI